MYRGGPELSERTQVKGCGVSFVLFEAITRVLPTEPIHFLVPFNLGDDRGGTDLRHSIVTSDHGTSLGEEDRNRALACGFDAYEIKLDRRSFLACVGELLQQDRSTAIIPGASDHE